MRPIRNLDWRQNWVAEFRRNDETGKEFVRDEKSPAVYILASKRNGTLYTGVTAALWNRVAAHKEGSVPGFTKKYDVKILVWYEHHHTMDSAVKRETRIKGWKRQWKLQLIEKFNPTWRDLHDEIDVISTLVPVES